MLSAETSLPAAQHCSQFLSARRISAVAAGHIGDRQVRNRGTIGGAICHADPAGDIPATMLALDAEFKVAGPSKGRVVEAQEFFKDAFTTSLRQSEILTEVRVPHLPPRSGGAYLKLERGTSDLATVGVAAVLTLDNSGAFDDARIGLAGVGSTPMRATRSSPAKTSPIQNSGPLPSRTGSGGGM